MRVQVAGVIEMPQWQEENDASFLEREHSHRMYASLKVHEDGHIQKGREFAMLLKARVMGLEVAPCGELARATREHSILYSNLRRRDEEYDRRTEHGLRQGNLQWTCLIWCAMDATDSVMIEGLPSALAICHLKDRNVSGR